MPLEPPLYDAMGTTRCSFIHRTGQRRLFTVLEAVDGGSPVGCDREGFDLARDITGRTNPLWLADVEVLESVYPVLCLRRGGGGSSRCRSVPVRAKPSAELG